MRNIFFVVFYIVVYVAKIINGGDTTTKILGNSMKQFITQKSTANRIDISEISIDDKTVQTTNKCNRQLLLVNRVDDWSQNRKMLTSNLRQDKRNLRKSKNSVNDLNKFVQYQNDFENNNDDGEDVYMRSEKRLIWEDPELTISAPLNMNPTKSSIIIQEAMNNRSLLMLDTPSQLESTLMNLNKRYLLIPISKDLYVLNNVRGNPQTSKKSISNPHKLMERNKNNVTSAILAFKALMHHKDIGLNRYLSDRNANYLPSFYLDSRISEEGSATLAANSTPLYPNFLYPHIVFQTRPNVINPEKSVECLILYNYENMSSIDRNVNINLNSKINSNDLVLSTSPLKILNYDKISSAKNVNNCRSSILPITKLNEISQFQSGNWNYKNSLKYDEFDGKLTTTDFQTIFDTVNDNVNVSVSLENRIYSTENNKEIFYLSQVARDNSKLLFKQYEDKNTTDFIDIISTRYVSSFVPANTYPFVDDTENILKNKNINEDNQEHKTTSAYNKTLLLDDFNYDNRFTDKMLFNNTTKSGLFLYHEKYTAPALSFSDKNKSSLKKEQLNIENPRSLLMAIKPLSSQLQKLLNTVKLVNQSIRNVQNRLCNENNIIKAARIERDNNKRKTTHILKLSYTMDYYNNPLFRKRLNNQPWRKRRIKNESVTNQTINDIEFRNKFNSSLFVNKLRKYLLKQRNLASNTKIDKDSRKFYKKRKINIKNLHSFNNVKKHRLSHFEGFNRNLKSLARNREMQVTSVREFVELRRIYTTTPVITLSNLIINKPRKNNSFNKHTHIRRYNDKSILLSRSIPFVDMPTNKDDQSYFLSNNKRNSTLHNAKRAMLEEMRSIANKEKTYSTIDPRLQKEITAYINILEMLKTRDVVHITQNITELLLISTTIEFPVTTFLPYFIEKPITLSMTTAGREEFLEVTSSTESTSYTKFEYYDYNKDYNERNYTGPYEDHENITSWYDYTETITSTISAILTIETAEETITTLTIAIQVEVTEASITSPAFATEEFKTESTILLTPILKDMTDITLKITIPLATETLIEETVEIVKEIIENTTSTMEITPSLFTSTSSYGFSITSFITLETKWIPTTTVSMPILTPLITTKRFKTAIAAEKTISMTQKTIAVTTVNLTLITTKFIVKEMEYVTLFMTQSLAFSTYSPIRITTPTEKTSKHTATRIITSAVQVASTTESTIEISTTLTTVSKIITNIITKITSLPATLKRPKTISPSDTVITPKEESPITQIEKTITVEEITTTETPQTTKIPAIKIPTTETIITITSIETLTIVKISTTIKLTTIEKTTTTIETSTSIESVTSATKTLLSSNITTVETETSSTQSSTSVFVKMLTTATIFIKTSRVTISSITIETTIITKPSTLFETTKASIETSTSPETLTTIKMSTPVKTLTITKLPTTLESFITSEATSAEILITKIPIVIETSRITETTIVTETSTQISSTAFIIITSIRTITPTTLLITSTLSSLIIKTLNETPYTTLSFLTTEKLPISTTISTIGMTISKEISEITIALTTITEKLIEMITNFTSAPVTEGTLTSENITLISIERSIFITETNITNIPLFVTSTILTQKVTETSLIINIESLATTKRPKVTTTMTFTPFFSFLPTLIMTKLSAITPESIFMLPGTTLLTKEFATVSFATTETVPISYTTESSSTIFTETTETTVRFTISTATTKKVTEAETEYYVAKGPMYEEEYEEYDTEIPTDRWYDYKTYKITEKKKTRITLSTIKYAKLPEITNIFFEETKRSPYKTETLEFTVSTSETSPATISILSYTYTKQEHTSTTIAETSIIIKNFTTIKVEIESVTITATEKALTTMGITFGSTEEYTLPSSTVFEIKTKPLPLEYPVSPEYSETESTSIVSTEKWFKIISSTFITQPEEISEAETKRIMISERNFTETEIIRKILTSVFVSSLLTTLSEKEAIEEHKITTMFLEMETATETNYAVTIWTITELIIEKKTVPYVTPFIMQTEFEFTTSKVVDQEQQKKQLLQQLEHFKQREKELAEKEERLKEKERQWDTKKEKRKKILRQKEAAKKTTGITGTTASYIATEITICTKEIETGTEDTLITYAREETTTTTLYITEKSILTTKEKISTIELYDISLFSVPVSTYSTKEIYTTYRVIYLNKSFLTSSIFTSPITLIIEELTTLTIPIEEVYTKKIAHITTYIPIYSELLFTSSTMMITSPITPSIDKFTALSVTFSETFEEINVTLLKVSTMEEVYTAAYKDIYSTFPFTLPTLLFTATTSVSSTGIISTTTEIQYDEEIEHLKEQLHKKKQELEKREKILLKREERLKKDILEFEKYMKEFEKEEMEETLIALLTQPTAVSTSFLTPVPPTEKITKAEVTQVKKITEKTDKQITTTKMRPRYKPTKVTTIREKERTEYIFERTVTQEEKEIATKKICLNVLKNITIPIDKTRRDIATKKVCLSYFPEKTKEKRLLGRVNRKLLAFQSAKKLEKSKWSCLSDFRYKRKSRMTTAYKINNLQLLHHEWLSNYKTTKPLHFKGFTRLYKKLRESFLRNSITNGQQNIADYSHRTSLYEHCVLDHHENFIQLTTSMLNAKKYRKRNAFFDHSLIPGNNNFFNKDKANIEKKSNLPIEENIRSLSTKNNRTANGLKHKSTTSMVEEKKSDVNENESFTVNVLQLSYNKDEETHELISVKPNQDELTVIISESYNDYATDINDLKEEHDKLFDIDKKTHQTEENDYVEDIIENYINYEEKKFSHLSGDENKLVTEFLNQVWPTEKSTTYYLGGTRFWALDFGITEPSAVLSVTTEFSVTIDMSAIKTTCLYVIIKNKRNDAEIKRNAYNNETWEHNNLVKQRDVSFPNVIRRISKPSAIVKELNVRSRKMYETKHHEQNFEEKKLMRHSELLSSIPIIDDRDSVIAKSRKLCGVNENKMKHQIVKHKDIVQKSKKKQLARLRTVQQNVDSQSLKVCTNSCIMNKKNLNNYHKTITVKTVVNHYSQVQTNDNIKNVAKITHRNNIFANRNNKSKSVSHGREIHDCSNCICDVVNIIDNIKSILDKVSFPLDKIRTLNCSKYKDTHQNKIVISMDSNMEEIKEFPQLRYNTELLKGQKYIKLDELENNFKSDFEFTNDHDIFSLPGVNLNLPCNQEGDDITWLSMNRPRYTWRRTDGIALFGFVSENGDLELRNVNAKDTGNYTCVMTYMSSDNEEPVETIYEVHLQVIMLPRYIVHGKNRYHTHSCDERDLDVLVTYLPLKLNSIICETDICNAYILTPSCSRNQIAINVLLVPSHIVKLMTVDPKHCNIFCLKAIQDKLSLILSRNLQIFLGKTREECCVIFRLPHYEQRLVPIAEKSSFGRWKRGKTSANIFHGGFGNIGLFSSCPAGYGLRGTHCVPCNTGTYSEDGISHCKKCPPGTYQPNHGARVCRSCTNPLTEGCYNMLWNSFSAVMITLASFSVIISIFLLLLWISCYIKKKFCIKQIATISKEEECVEERLLRKDVSENEDQQRNSEYRIKNKKGKFYVNKKRRKQNEKRKYEKINTHQDEWESHRVKNTSIICPDSYRSHETFNNHYLKQLYRKGPQLPECDFDT